MKGACLTSQQNLKRDFPDLRVVDLCPVCEIKIGFHVSEPTTVMSPDSKLKLSSIQLLVEESIKISSKALQVALMNNVPTTPTNDIVRHTSYSSLYSNCSVEISLIRSNPEYLDYGVEIAPNELFFPENQNIVARGDKESVLQKYGNMQFFEHSSALKVTHHDTHKTPFFTTGDQPDNVFCPKLFAATPMVAVTVLEWKAYAKVENKGFDTSCKGQAISYAQLILDAQKWRTFALACIADLDLFQCFEVRRINNGAYKIIEYQSVHFFPIGRNILWRLLTVSTEALGFVTERAKGLPSEIDISNLTPFSCGGSSMVYSSIVDQIVVKVYRSAFLATMKVEVDIYEKIGGSSISRPSSVGTIRSHGDNCIVLKNYGVMLDILHPSSCYCDILRALRFVHDHGISHNDVRLPNIVVELENRKATLIDWGNAKMDATVEEKMQDIMSLIRLFITNKYFHGFSPVLITESNDKFIESIPRFWLPLFIAAEAFNYEQMIELLEHGGSQVNYPTEADSWEKFSTIRDTEALHTYLVRNRMTSYIPSKFKVAKRPRSEDGYRYESCSAKAGT
eukprot:gene14896-20033_t